jgi:hypothetical protein
MLAAMIAAIAGQAQALSCAPPDIARTFNWASAADESYIVLNGSFSFQPLPRNRTRQLNPETTTHDAVFEGSYLGADGFISAPALDVTLTFVCLGPWCGSIEDGDDILVFAQQTANGYIIEVDPCFGSVFAPSDDNIDRVEACMRGENCEAVPF